MYYICGIHRKCYLSSDLPCLMNIHIFPVCNFFNFLLKISSYQPQKTLKPLFSEWWRPHWPSRVKWAEWPFKKCEQFLFIWCSCTVNVSYVPYCNYYELCTCGGGWSIAETTSAGLFSGFSNSTGIFSCYTRVEPFTQNVVHYYSSKNRRIGVTRACPGSLPFFSPCWALKRGNKWLRNDLHSRPVWICCSV